MPLTASEQLSIATQAISRGDVDLLEKLLLDPDTVTIDEQRTAAQRLGVKGGFLEAITNLAADPTVWLAFLASKTFPVASWLRGTIPNRYIGVAAEFTGLSSVARPVEGFFRGTPVPRIIALARQRHAEVMKEAQSMFDLFLHRPGWKDEMPTVSMLLEGQNPTNATPELRALAGQIRGRLGGMWDYLKGAQKIEGGLGGGDLSFARAVPKNAPKHLRDYLPHIPLLGQDSIIEISGASALKRMGRGRFSQVLQLKNENPAHVWNASSADELSSEFIRYQRFVSSVGDKINPHLFKRQRHGIPLESALGRELFVTDLNVLLPRYVESVARTYANNVPISEAERRLISVRAAGGRVIEGNKDPLIVQMINQGLKAAGGRVSRRPIPGVPGRFVDVVSPGSLNAPMVSGLDRLTRALRGGASDDEILFGNAFSSILGKVDRIKANFTGKQLSETTSAIRAFERTSSYRQKVNGIAGYFYATTLGLNPWSAIQNLFQPVITTIPAIGLGATLRGYRELGRRLPAYADAVKKHHRLVRQNRGVTGTEAFNESMERGFLQAFPELAKQGIRIDPRLFDIDEALMTGSARGKVFRSVDSINKAILQPFTNAEMANRVVTFFGGRTALQGASKMGSYIVPKGATVAQTKELFDFEAGMLVNATQFAPGPGSRTLLQGALPAPFRQFTSFPSRLLNFHADSTVRGAMTAKQMEQASLFNILQGGESGQLARQKAFSLGSGRNVGVLARTFLYGKIVKEGAASALGVDLQRVLGVTGPLESGGVFAPFPMPPMPSVAYGVMSAAINRDSDRLQPLELPGGVKIPFLPKTLVPGGVAITRAARALNQYRPDVGGFVDDNERLLYRGSDLDLMFATLGIPIKNNRRARDVMERVQSNRRRIREIRREFSVAKMNFDTKEMGRLQQVWKSRFPDMPPLDISNRDLRRYKENARIPVVQRMLRTLGKNGAFMERELYEHDPDLLAPPAPPRIPSFGGGR